MTDVSFSFLNMSIAETNGIDSKKTNPNPFNKLPTALIVEFFSYLNLSTLGTTCCVSKEWKLLASKDRLWKKAIFDELAFGNKQWAQCFGKEIIEMEDSTEEFSSLPLDIVENYKRFHHAFPKKNTKDSLMLVRLPKTLNGQLTLKSFGELAKQYFPKNVSGYVDISADIVNTFGDKSIDKSRWVLMTTDVIPGSSNQNYAVQQEIVADLAKKGLIGFEVPETLEATVCILAQYFKSRKRLFSDDANPTWIRCRENVEDIQVTVRFCKPGLNIRSIFSKDQADESFCVAALQKL